MGSMNTTLDNLLELVMDYEQEDPIDFGMVAIKEEEAFRIIIQGVLEMVRDVDPDNLTIVLTVALIRALTENMILQLQKVQDISI